MSVRTVWCVYRMFDDQNRLIYVGCSANLPNRLEPHRSQPWWRSVTRVEVEHHPGQRSALAAEAKAIRDERPAVNRPPNNGGGPRHPRRHGPRLTPLEQRERGRMIAEFVRYNALLGGYLPTYLATWRSVDPPVTFDTIALDLLEMTGEPVTGETVRRWCIEQGIAA